MIEIGTATDSNLFVTAQMPFAVGGREIISDTLAEQIEGASQWNEATTAVGYTGSSDSRVHFGLGKNRVIKDVEIRWPSGIRQVLHEIAADQILTVEEPQR